MILDKRGAALVLLIGFGAWLFGGVGAAVVATSYAPLPDVPAAAAGLVLGTAAAAFFTGRPDMARWATLRRRAGRWVPRFQWDLVQLVFGVVAAWGTAGVTVLVARLL
ncbi:hypothetical protein ACFVYG_14700 [Streptomyces sp. NPDC058256]|uniref:hypothetical protein n=1 Tax=Streptomyces sp. NPDC058256 TaxID=3346408 RepID=UPI0036E24304